MGLELTGELLACSTETVTSRDGKFADFLSTTIVVMDGTNVTEARAGRDLPASEVARIKESAKDRPQVRFGVFLLNGKTYVTDVKSMVAEGAKPVQAVRAN